MLSFPQAGVKTKNNACKPFKQAPLLGRDWKKWNRFSTEKILNAPSIKKTQFPLAIARTIYCSQVPRPKLGSQCCGFNLKKRKSFGTVQIYITLSRIKTYNKLFCAGEYKSSSINNEWKCSFRWYFEMILWQYLFWM